MDRVRYAAPDRASLEVLQAGNAANGCVVSVPVSAEGRLELLWYVREQSISTDYHRYGNLGTRAAEHRRAKGTSSARRDGTDVSIATIDERGASTDRVQTHEVTSHDHERILQEACPRADGADR